MTPALQVNGVLLLLAIFGPLYALILVIAIWFGWSEKRKLARGLAREAR